MKKYIIYTLLILSWTLAGQAFGQLNPLGASHFRNQYLSNPAMAGFNPSLQIQASYRQQWQKFPGSPSTQSLTAEYGFEKVGLGLNFYSEKSGLLNDTRTMLTYVYHLSLNEQDRLHFGISLGAAKQNLNNDIIGDPNDQSLARYSDRPAYFDGDFGVAYRRRGLILQAAVPKLKSFFSSDEQIHTVDKASYFLSAQYRFKLDQNEDGTVLEPKLSLRIVDGYTNIFDVGINTSILNDQVQLYGLYHSTQNATFGFGFNYRKLSLSGMYTSETSDIRSAAGGNFELGLQFRY